MRASGRWLGLACAQFSGWGAAGVAAREWTLYVGTYDRGGSPGIHAYAFDDSSGRLRRLGLAATASDASFMAWGPDQRVLYTVNESITDKAHDGALEAWSRWAGDFRLHAFDRLDAGGKGTCYVAVSPEGGQIAAANYGSGSLVVLPLQQSGMFAAPLYSLQLEGRGTDPVRQEGPHAHCATYDPAGKFLFCCDLGTDHVLIYRRDDPGLVLSARWTLPAGFGPRHAAFLPSLRRVYVIGELSSTIAGFDWPGSGRLIQTISTLPRGMAPHTGAAEIQISPDGHFLYASNRGADSIATFAIQSGGTLAEPVFQPCGGRTPRHFTLDPTGRFLVCANQGSGKVQVFSRDAQTGRLEPKSSVGGLGQPVYLLFLWQ